jgi:hypothetical protein
MLLSIVPLARTPMDKKSAQALNKYQKSLDRSLRKMTPWKKDASRLSKLRGKVKSGEVAVVLSGGESSNHPLFDDLRVIRE